MPEHTTISLLLRDGREAQLPDCGSIDEAEALLRLAEELGEKLGDEIDPADVVEIRAYDREGS